MIATSGQLLKHVINIKRWPLKRREKLVLGGSLCIFLFLGLMWVQPRLSDIKYTYLQIAAKKEELNRLQQQRSLLTNFQSGPDAKNFQSYLTQSQRRLPDTKPSLPILVYLNRLARQEQVLMSGISLNPGAIKEENVGDNSSFVLDTGSEGTPQGVVSFDLVIGVSGPKERLISFMQQLQRLSPLTKIESFSFEIDEVSGLRANTLKATLQLKVFYESEPQLTQEAAAVVTLQPVEAFTEEELSVLNNLQNSVFIQDDLEKITTFINSSKIGKQNPFQ